VDFTAQTRPADTKPYDQHGWLLQAALLHDGDARRAWAQWSGSIDLDHLPAGQYLLLPLLYRNLEYLGVEHPWLSRLKGVYRRCWYANHLALRRLADVVAALAGADVDALLVGEAVSVLSDYPEVSTRPIPALQIAVRPAAFDQAARLLAELGWRMQSHQFDLLSARHRVWGSSVIFYTKGGPSLRLHQHLLADVPNPVADELLWSKACSLRVNDVVAQTLSPADRLAMICLSAHTMGPVALADVALLLRRESVNWERLLSLARQLEVGAPLLQILEVLQAVLGLELSPELLASLRRASSARVHDASLRFGLAGRPRTLLQTWRTHYRRFQRLAKSQGQPTNLRTFLAYAQCVADVAHPWQLLPKFVARVLRNNREKYGGRGADE
jgi:hypothetical protein